MSVGCARPREDAYQPTHPPGHRARPCRSLTGIPAPGGSQRGLRAGTGADPAVVTAWIAQTQAERARADADIHASAGDSPRRMSRAGIRSLLQALGDIVAELRDADPDDKAEVYRQLGLRLNYQPETQTVRAAIDLSAHRGAMVCVRGATSTRNP